MSVAVTPKPRRRVRAGVATMRKVDVTGRLIILSRRLITIGRSLVLVRRRLLCVGKRLLAVRDRLKGDDTLTVLSLDPPAPMRIA